MPQTRAFLETREKEVEKLQTQLEEKKQVQHLGREKQQQLQEERQFRERDMAALRQSKEREVAELKQQLQSMQMMVQGTMVPSHQEVRKIGNSPPYISGHFILFSPGCS